MIPAETALDSRRAYAFALEVQRLRLVTSGDVLPREDERLDIVLMAALRS